MVATFETDIGVGLTISCVVSYLHFPWFDPRPVVETSDSSTFCETWGIMPSQGIRASRTV